jgi:hypothetical protein
VFYVEAVGQTWHVFHLLALFLPERMATLEDSVTKTCPTNFDYGAKWSDESKLVASGCHALAVARPFLVPVRSMTGNA